MSFIWARTVLVTAIALAPLGAAAACVTATAQPNRGIALFDGRAEPEPEASHIASYLAGPMAGMGLFPTYVDVARPLPAEMASGPVAGVISWFGGPVEDAEALAAWLDARDAECGRVLPMVAIGDAGGAALWARLGVDGTTAWMLHNGVSRGIEVVPMWRGTQAPLALPPGRLLAPVLPSGAAAMVTLPGLDGTRRALGFRLGSRMWLSALTVVAQEGRAGPLLVADPDQIITAFTGEGSRPVPDLAVFQGRRIALSILLADGWRMRGPALGMASLGQPAYARALEVFGQSGAKVAFGWPDAHQDQTGSDAAATAAGRALAPLPHVRALPLDVTADGFALGAPSLLRLSYRDAGGQNLTPRADPPVVYAQMGGAGFADPTGLHARTGAVTRSDLPRPTAPDTLVVRARDLLEASGQAAVVKALATHASPARASMDVVQYAAWLKGAVSARIIAEAPQAWRVYDRGALATLRIDRAVDWALDMHRSTGTLGSWRAGSALFVAMDPAVEVPLVALNPRSDAMRAGQSVTQIVEAGPALSDRRHKGCETSFTAQGSGRITFRAGGKVAARLGTLPLEVTSPQEGVMQVVLPAHAAPQTVFIAGACP